LTVILIAGLASQPFRRDQSEEMAARRDERVTPTSTLLEPGSANTAVRPVTADSAEASPRRRSPRTRHPEELAEAVDRLLEEIANRLSHVARRGPVRRSG
jgi:hypothetical protein